MCKKNIEWRANVLITLKYDYEVRADHQICIWFCHSQRWIYIWWRNPFNSNSMVAITIIKMSRSKSFKCAEGASKSIAEEKLFNIYVNWIEKIFLSAAMMKFLCLNLFTAAAHIKSFEIMRLMILSTARRLHHVN